MDATLNLGLIADVHHGAKLGTIHGPAALPLLGEFTNWVNRHPLDLVVELGDRINDVDAVTDEKLTRDVAAAFGRIEIDRAHILGNHDNHDLSRNAAEAAMQVSFNSYSRDIKGYHLIFWNANTCMKGKQHFEFDPADLRWLESDLKNPDLPTVVFTHIPLDEGSMLGNYYFEKHASRVASYVDSKSIREVLERSGKVILCLSGHTHWNARNTIDGIHYVTIHSLTESFTTWPHPTGAYGYLRLGEHIEIEVLGRDPAYYRLPIRQMGRHWLNLDRPYAPKPELLSPFMAACLKASAQDKGSVDA